MPDYCAGTNHAESRYTMEIEVRFEVLDTVKNPFATKARS